MANTAIRQRLLTVDQFACLTGLKPKTVRQKIWRRDLEHVKIGRNVRLRAELVDELIERGTVPAVDRRPAD
jgi:excisionase family DNA binding protein